MAGIPDKVIVDEFHVMLAEHWPYVWGAAQKGKVDCSGAFVYVYKKYGHSIYHGSNRIARRHVHDLMPYAEAKAKGLIRKGMAALKTRKPGDAKYDLPGQYKQGGAYCNGDMLDYYHIGLVDEDIDLVMNAQGSKTGFVKSKISENWSHVALLNDVDYTTEQEGDDDPMGKAKVIGGALFLRDKPSKDAKKLARMENGTVVQVIEENGDWCKVAPVGPVVLWYNTT